MPGPAIEEWMREAASRITRETCEAIEDVFGLLPDNTADKGLKVDIRERVAIVIAEEFTAAKEK